LRILLPLTNRVHAARQQLLIKELKKEFDLHVISYEPKGDNMTDKALDTAQFFDNVIATIKPKAIIARGDRYEVLGIAMVSVYHDVPIIHIEAGDLSGTLDNKVRHAVTQLADIHFTTNEESRQRVVQMGIPIDKVFNYGSLDVEYAHSIKPQKLSNKPYILLLHHEIPLEPTSIVYEALKPLSERFEIITTKGNKDYHKNPNGEEFEPKYFIQLLRQAECLVGNSSAGLKEASILGTSVVNVGTRQKNRLRTHNIIDVPCEVDRIRKAVEYQVEQNYEPDKLYFRKDTSKNICQEIKRFLANV